MVLLYGLLVTKKGAINRASPPLPQIDPCVSVSKFFLFLRFLHARVTFAVIIFVLKRVAGGYA